MPELPQRLREMLEDADEETLNAAIDFAEAQLAETPSEADE